MKKVNIFLAGMMIAIRDGNETLIITSSIALVMNIISALVN